MGIKTATIFFIEGINKDYIEADVNGKKFTYNWTEDDISELRSRIESAGVESIMYSGVNVFAGRPMSIERVNKYCIKLAEMV